MTTRKFGRTLLVAALALSLVLSITGGTIAWFTDSVESSTNVITAGNLDVELYHTNKTIANEKVGTSTKLFKIEDNTLWEPGMVAWENLTVKNEGSLHLYYDLGINVSGENYVIDGNNQYGLSGVLKMAVLNETIDASASRDAVMAKAQNGALLATASHTGDLAAGASKTYGVIVYWEPSANDNNWNVNNSKTTSDNQPLHITLGVKLNATQMDAEKDAFDKDYDADAKLVKSYNELQAALNAGEPVVLEKDITLPSGSSLTIPQGATVTLNLNGKKITGSNIKDSGALIINNGTVTITGGTVENTKTNGDSVIKNNGTMVLDDVAINGAPIGETGYPAYAITGAGKLTVEKGTTITSDRGAIYMNNGADVTINGGNVSVTDALGSRVLTAHVIYAYGSNSKLTINDGNFAQNYKAAGNTGASVICPAGATINIYDGNFTYAGTVGQSGIFQNYMGYGAPVNVYGGTYNDTTVNKNVATGYEVTNNGNGTYTVSAPKADTAEAVKDAIASAGAVELTDDIKYNTAINNDAKIDLAGNTFEATGTINLGNNADLTMTGGDYVVNSTYGHVDVRPSTAEGSKVVFENVDFSYNKLDKTWGTCTNRLGSVVEVCATVADANTEILFKNCTFDNAQVLFEGMSGKTGTFDATFENCTFNALTSSAPIKVDNYVKGTITVKDCTFNLEATSSSASAISITNNPTTTVTLKLEGANTVNAKAATPTDASLKGTVNEVKLFNGVAPTSAKVVSYDDNTTVTGLDTVTVTGIATK